MKGFLKPEIFLRTPFEIRPGTGFLANGSGDAADFLEEKGEDFLAGAGAACFTGAGAGADFFAPGNVNPNFFAGAGAGAATGAAFFTGAGAGADFFTGEFFFGLNEKPAESEL